MGEMLGADPAQLRELAKEALRGGEKLGQASVLVSNALQRAAWHGQDAQRFRNSWSSQHRRTLQKVASELGDVATMLQRNAEEQERASSASDGQFSPTGSGNGLTRDRPDDPTAPDGMGPYKPLPKDIPLNDEALDPTNMKQGQIGDCWFLAAAGAVAQNDPDWIREHVSKNADGTWTVKMYHNGEPVLITVDPTAPEFSAKDAQGDPNWLTIYEKAAAEYFGGSYEDLDGGHSDVGMAAITGKETMKTGDVGFDEMKLRLKDGPVALGTEGKAADWFFWQEDVDDDRIVPNHAYIVDKLEERENPQTGKTETMIHVINPWGPNGGNLEGDKDVDGKPQRWGDLWLTEQEYKDNFRTVYSAESTKK